MLGIDAPRDRGGAQRARADGQGEAVASGIAPGDDPKTAFLALQAHLERHAPWGAEVSLTLEHDGSAVRHRRHRAGLRRGSRRLRRGLGRRRRRWTWASAARSRSSPRSRTSSPAPSILVTGVEDPDARAHGPNESLHLGEFARVCLAEALLLARVAEIVPPRP